MSKLYPVPFLCGDGSGEIMLEVSYIANGTPYGEAGRSCAFCHGDPCAENDNPEAEINKYFARNEHPETCPCCSGRPS